MESITCIPLRGLPLIQAGDGLVELIAARIEATLGALREGDIVVVAQKIVSKAEGRFVDLDTIVPSERADELGRLTGKDSRYVEVVLSESEEVVRHGSQLLIVAHRLGFVMANAGIDESNVEQEPGGRRVLLLPRDPDGSAAQLREEFEERFGVRLGVIINDSFGRPWRNGVVGVALGAAGVPALADLIGAPDLFGRAMRVTEVALADELASAASILMGQADEGCPVVIVRGFASAHPPRPAAALVRPRERDLFR